MQKTAPAGSAAAEQPYADLERLLGRIRVGSLEAPEVASIGLTALGLLLIGVSLMVAHLRLDDYGLAGSLPITYVAGVACLPLASGILLARGRRLAPLLVLQVAIFVLTLWLTPLALEGTPRFRTSYVSFGFLDPLLRGVGFRPTEVVYHNWPLFPISMAPIVGVLQVPALTLMGWFPALIMLAYLVPLGGLLRLVTGRDVRPFAPAPAASDAAAGSAALANRDDDTLVRSSIREAGTSGRLRWLVEIRGVPPLAWIGGLWFFVAFDWTGQDYFSPQALAYLFFLCWALLLAHVAIRREGRLGLTETALALAIFTAIVLTHALTSMIALGALAALTVARMVRRPTLVVTCGLIFLVWNVYAAAPFYRSYADLIVSTALSIGTFFSSNLSSRVAGSPQHEQVALIRILVTAVAFALAALGLVLARIREGSWSRETRFALVFLVGLVVVAPISVYGGEMLIRTLLFALPMLAILVVRALGTPLMRWGLVAALVVAGPLQLLTHYGNERYDYVSPDELAGWRVIYDQLAPANLYGAFPGGDFMNVAQLDWRNAVLGGPKLALSIDEYRAPQNRNWAHRDWPIYVAFSRGDEAAADIFYRQGSTVAELRKVLADKTKYRLVYQNPDISIYRWLGPPPPQKGKP